MIFKHIKRCFTSMTCLVVPLMAYGEVDFNRDIRPIFTSQCTECHGGVKAAGGVSFVYRDQVISFESDSGRPVVKPGDPEGSELFYRITTDDPDDRMPPAEDHAPLSKREIETIKQWILQGAPWSGHWAFEPPVQPEIPSSNWELNVVNNIDRFIHARLEKEKLSPAPPAEAGRLLRRLSLALTGLPPTLEEVRQFEKSYQNTPKDTLEKTVHQLMSKPAFGERWASMWLDLVRYADSRGLGSDARRTIWPYRDWVVKAFNEDLPFDQFTLLQLAGDLLPEPSLDSIIATACHRNTQTNDEGGTDDEEFRIGALMDRVNTTWQAWGATTFNCVQCHDHPYDTFRHEEYYRFMAYFNNTSDSDLPNEGPVLSIPEDKTQHQNAVELDQKILQLQEKYFKAGKQVSEKVDWIMADGLEVESNNGTQYVVDKSKGYDEYHTVGTVQTQTAVTIKAPAKKLTAPIQAIRCDFLPLDPDTSIHSPEWGFVISKLEAWAVDSQGEKKQISFKRSFADVPWMPHSPFKTISWNGVGFGADSRIHHERSLILIPMTPIDIAQTQSVALTIHCSKTGHGHPMLIKRGHLAFSTDSAWAELNGESSEVESIEKALSTALNERKSIKSIQVPVMLERPANITRPTHVFMRGNFLDKGQQVTAALPASMSKETGSDQSNRLEMARWWASRDNPLTARVFVNRLWEQLFGIGIVPTLEDFGSAGEAPTHPELLDYLALRFQNEHQWSMKSMLSEMVLNATFQQSAKVSAQLWEKDPENRLLARGPRGRLPAEMVRDQALALSGLLSGKLGGPPVRPPIPNGVWQPFDAGDKWNTVEKGNPDRYRRSIYTYMKRSIPYPAFASFDAPSREFCTPRRLVSNTPIQALVTLNDTTFFECAEALGGRMEHEFPGDIRAKLLRACHLVTASKPEKARVDALVAMYDQLKTSSAPDENVNPWTAIAQVLLNLDEVLNY